MGLGNAIAPIAVRERVPDRPATGTGVYTTGIQIGSTVAAALAVPLAALLGGWRGALIAFSRRRVRRRRRLGRARARRRAPHVRPPRLVPAAPVALAHGLAARRDLRLDGLGVLRPERLASRRLRRAGLERRVGGLLLAVMNLTAIPGVVRRPVAVGPARGPAAWLARP